MPCCVIEGEVIIFKYKFGALYDETVRETRWYQVSKFVSPVFHGRQTEIVWDVRVKTNHVAAHDVRVWTDVAGKFPEEITFIFQICPEVGYKWCKKLFEDLADALCYRFWATDDWSAC